MLSKPNAVPKPLPREKDRKAAKREEQSTLRSVYKLVDARDRACRCCGLMGVRSLEHHHIKPRSRGGKHDTANVVRLCRLCHRLAQQYRIWIEGTDANTRLVFVTTPGIAAVVFSHRAIPANVRVEEIARD